MRIAADRTGDECKPTAAAALALLWEALLLLSLGIAPSKASA
jgi:hypothetical protein